VSLVSVPDTGAARFSPRILAACQRAARTFEPEWLVVLGGGHILQTDVRPVLDALHAVDADVSLLALAARPEERQDAYRERPRREGSSSPGRATSSSARGACRCCCAPSSARAPRTGIRPRPSPRRCLSSSSTSPRPHETGPGSTGRTLASLEAYYASQMDLCTPEPALDLYDPELADPFGDGRPAAGEGRRRTRRAATWARR
jgi:hypothetical protein